MTNPKYQTIRLLLLAVLVHFPADLAFGYYNPQAGRWLARDPLNEPGFVQIQTGQRAGMSTTGISYNTTSPRISRWAPSLGYAFVHNAPVDSLDILGLVAGGGTMQMYCRQPCEDFRRSEEENDRKVPAGAVVCCGGVKFICTWGADKEKNATAREILRECIRRHERIHVPSVSCDQCSTGPLKVKNKKQDRAFCEEEMQGEAVEKSCLESFKIRCGTDSECIRAVEDAIGSADFMYNFYKALCSRFPK